jgi:peptide/nickel transport system substrate-binding protein
MVSRVHPRSLAPACLLILALLLSACGQSTAPPPAGGGAATPTGNAAVTPTAGGAAGGGGVINISLNADPPKLDPAQSSAFVDRQVLNNLCDKLFDLGPDGKIVPMLVTGSQISEDKLTYTFTLRDGVKFHDGTDLNADAVKFNLTRDMAPSSPRLNELTLVKSVDVVDPKTIKITLKEPFAPFLSILTDRAGMIVSPTAAQAEGDNFLQKPVCSGPFKFQDRVKGDHITLVRNENYWRPGLPKADKLVYKIFTDANTALVNLRSGQVDMTDVLPAKEVPGLAADKNFAVVNKPGLGYQGIWLNVKQAPLDKKEVRQAINMLIDRDALVKVVFSGLATPGNSAFSQGSLAYGDSDKYTAPNLQQAKDLLTKAGATNVTFTLKTGTDPIGTQIAELIQNFLKPAGINMQIEKVEFGTLLDQMDKHNFQAGALGWSGRPDPDQNIFDFFITDGKNNNAGYSNPQVDDLLKAARSESDEAKRKADYDKVMDILHDEVPYVFLYHPNNAFGMKSSLTGFTYVPDGIIRVASMQKK